MELQLLNTLHKAKKMNSGFWIKIKLRAVERGAPILAMAPMANVTDAAFRRMFAAIGAAAPAGHIGKPDVFWTEFVSVEGLLSRGREQLLVDFWYGEAERPIVAQVFGDKPEQFEEVARLVRELGFDGIDINMGCPDSGVEKSGAGAALIRDPARACEIIRAVKRGATSEYIKSDGTPAAAIPVSVKTRLGYRSTDEMNDWLTTILKEDVAALTVHLRTRNEMSAVPAHWELARGIVELRDRVVGRPAQIEGPHTLILANGDVASLDEANKRAAETGVDGVMIGRGMFGNPWFFRADLGGHAPDLREKLLRMVEHTELFEKLYRSKPVSAVGASERQLKNFDIMKKHFKAYCSGFDDAKELRIKLMGTKNAGEVRKIVEEFLMERKAEE
jgi:tRNA-dihydrouridine synthase